MRALAEQPKQLHGTVQTDRTDEKVKITRRARIPRTVQTDKTARMAKTVQTAVTQNS